MIKLLGLALLVLSSVSLVKDIKLTGSAPELREDDSALTAIDRFNIYYDLDGVFQSVIKVEANSNNYTLANASSVAYEFQMSTVSLELVNRVA